MARFIIKGKYGIKDKEDDFPNFQDGVKIPSKKFRMSTPEQVEKFTRRAMNIKSENIANNITDNIINKNKKTIPTKAGIGAAVGGTGAGLLYTGISNLPGADEAFDRIDTKDSIENATGLDLPGPTITKGEYIGGGTALGALIGLGSGVKSSLRNNHRQVFSNTMYSASNAAENINNRIVKHGRRIDGPSYMDQYAKMYPIIEKKIQNKIKQKHSPLFR